MGGAGSGMAYDEADLRRIAGAGPAGQPHHRGAARGVDPRLEGVRARADARPQRQRRGRLLDREPRPDGRAHRRLDHRGAGDDADRPRVPAHARPRHRDHPRGRRRHRRLQHPVRGQPGRRPADRHRDEPAGVALERAGVARRPASRSPRSRPRLAIGYTLDEIPNDITARDAGLVRADARLRRGQGAAVRVREVPAAPTRR